MSAIHLVLGLATTCLAQQQLDKIVPFEGVNGDSFGVSCDHDADTCVVGAYQSDLAADFGGAAFIFETDNGVDWFQVTPLTAGVPDVGAQFGRAVAISGDYVIVGAEQDDAGADTAGAAYVFERNAGGPGAWGEVAQLVPDDLQEVALFGHAVDIDGEWAVVGSPNDDDAGANAGAAYIYRARRRRLDRRAEARPRGSLGLRRIRLVGRHRWRHPRDRHPA